MKKLFIIILAMLSLLCSCKSGDGGYIDADPKDIIEAVYASVEDSGAIDEYKTMLIYDTVTADNELYYLGVNGIEYEAAVASEPEMQPCPYSFVVVRLKKGADYDAQRKLIEKNLNKSKWVCTSCEEALTVRFRNFVAVIMCDKKAADALEAAYLNVMDEKFGIR